MGLPKPLGKHAVAFGDFELRRIDERPASEGPYPPPFRVFYPTSAKQPSGWRNLNSRSWLPDLHYTWGFCCTMLAPTTLFRRLILWVIASTVHITVWPWSSIYANVASPILPAQEDDEESHLPVVIFSHGLWACRTTYSAFCCDLASHGYVVVAVEHLDGSAQMAKFIDRNGKKNWLPYSFATTPVSDITVDDRADQLNLRTEEIRKVVDILESINNGLLTQGSNIVTGETKLDVTSLLHRLDMNHLAAAGHSFGGLTAVAVSGLDDRFMCCLGMDVWWEPLESKKVNFDKSSMKVPLILINSEKFDWPALKEARLTFLKERLVSSTKEDPLVTDMMIIKGTVHQNQSDFPLIFKSMAKKLGLNGTLLPETAKNVNNRACLEFLQQNLLPPGTTLPHPVESVQEDKEYLITQSIEQLCSQ